MDKWLIHKSTMELLEDSPVTKMNLGVIGASTAKVWNRETITDIMNPVLGELGLPDTIFMPTEGVTSILLQTWAERQNIACQAVSADWIRLGRRARALRDGRILKESSHLIMFIGRSDYYEKIAIRELKRGKRVFTVQNADISELEL